MGQDILHRTWLGDIVHGDISLHDPTCKMKHNILHLDSVTSTNSWLAVEGREMPHATVVTTREQTAGRGQRGNSWESQPGANLTFSMLLRPESIAAHSQFTISEAVALGIADALRHYLPADRVKIKWSNDIYVDNRKICGILIENSITGDRIGRSIAGIGINVNQEEFHSDAPNPVSMRNITGIEYNLDEVLNLVIDSILARLDEGIANPASLHRAYIESLWGKEGRTYRDTATGEIFSAIIEDVAPIGHIHLRDTSGRLRIHAFKEIAVIL